jgi:hypothetical protein
MRYLLSILCLMITRVAVAQDASPLPRPSGSHPVGRVSFHWTDPARPEILTAAPEDRRELVVHVWYPAAASTGPTAAYFPDAHRLAGSDSAGAYLNLFPSRWSSILNEQFRSHAKVNAPIVEGMNLPILIFSPGGGVTSIAYTTQLEELASQGYLVFGVEHTYHLPAVVVPGGRVIAAADEQLARIKKETSYSDNPERKITEMLVTDMIFVIDKLGELAESNTLFRSKLDMSQIGVFGHSRGGRVAAHLCQIDRRVKACINQDGMMQWHPFWLDERGESLAQPFMMLDHLDLEPPDEAFVQMGITREAYSQNRSERRRTAREQIFTTIEGGSYHVTLATPGISHNSFLDVRLLGRTDMGNINSWPKDVQEATPHAQILRRITDFTSAFFNKYLRGMPAPLLDDPSETGPEVTVQRYRRETPR